MNPIALKIRLLLLILLISTAVEAQRNLFSHDSIPRALTRKNEIGININPVLGFINPNLQHQKRFEISYKRILNEKSAFRTSVGVTYFGYRSYSSWKSNKLAENGSYSQNSSTSYIKIGYERRFARKKLEFFYGADILIGYYRNQYSSPITKYQNDSLLSPLNSLAAQEMKTESGFKLGVSPFIGARYNFTDAFSVSVQMGYDFTYQFGQKVVNTDNNITRTRTRAFNQPGFFTDVSFRYKF